MSYKNQQLNVNNVTSHTHTIFDLIATEAGQQKIVDAINNINISAEIGEIVVESSDSITHSKLDTLNNTVSDKHLNSSTDSVNIGNFPTSTEISNFPTDTAKEAKQDTQIEELQKIVNKTGDITAQIPYSQGAQVWADTIPIPTQNPNNSNGWIYTNTNTGNAMNLYYFNGNSETKTLNEVVAQYCVVTNLGTVLNDKLIFVVYTKSNTSFFTTSLTHSPANNIDMVPGGKYVLYWGNVPDDLYPNLPRLNFSVVIQNGPGNPSEQILSCSLNTDSGAVANEINILIESLGVVFSNGTTNQSRVYNLITDNTEYQSLKDIDDTLTDIKNKTNLINSFGGLWPNSIQVGIANHDQRAYVYNGDGSSQISSTINTVSNKMGLDVFVSNNNDINVNTGLNLSTLATETTLNDIKTNTNKINSDTTNTDAIQVQVKNSSIDTHNKVFHSGNWVNLVGASNGHLLVNSSTQSGDGTDITSTNIGVKEGLDVNLINASIPVSGSVSISGTPSVNATITNSSVPVSISAPVIIGSTAANTISIAGYDNSTLTNKSITITDTGVKTNLDTYINNGSITNLQSITGLNVVSVLPKFKNIQMSGTANTGANTVLTAIATTIIDFSSSSVIFGASYLRSYNAQITGAGATSKNILVDYVNSEGVEVIGEAKTVGTSTTTILNNVWGVNRVYLSTSAPQQQLSSTENIQISFTRSGQTIISNRITFYGELSAFYTVPLNCVAFLTQFSFWSQATENFSVQKFSANGTRIRLRNWVNASNFNSSGSITDGGIVGYLVGGDTLFFNSELATATSKIFNAQVYALQLN